MRASETLLNEAAWRTTAPLRWLHGSQTDGLTVRSRSAGRTDADARALSLGLLCEAQKALDPDYGHNIAAAGRTAVAAAPRLGLLASDRACTLHTYWRMGMDGPEGGREGRSERDSTVASRTTTPCLL